MAHIPSATIRRAKALRKDGKTYKQIAHTLDKEDLRGINGRRVHFSTVGYWFRNSNTKSKRARARAHKVTSAVFKITPDLAFTTMKSVVDNKTLTDTQKIQGIRFLMANVQ